MNDPLIDIWQFSPTMTIRQVVTFFERKGLPITRAMVQNYIRLGLMPPPNGRHYTHKHLAALAMIDRLKTVFDMDAIRENLRPLMDSEGLPLDIYSALFAKAGAILSEWAKITKAELEAQHDGGTLLTMLIAAGLKATAM